MYLPTILDLLWHATILAMSTSDTKIMKRKVKGEVNRRRITPMSSEMSSHNDKGPISIRNDDDIDLYYWIHQNKND